MKGFMGDDNCMCVFVTGVCGQLGHDVMNELVARGYEVVGSDIQPAYSGIADGSSVTSAPYENKEGQYLCDK